VNRFTQCPLDDPLRKRLKDKCHITGKEVMASRGVRDIRGVHSIAERVFGHYGVTYRRYFCI